jgi:hypothetical protein
MPKPEIEFFPRPAKFTDGSYIYDRIPPSAQVSNAIFQNLKRVIY